MQRVKLTGERMKKRPKLGRYARGDRKGKWKGGEKKGKDQIR